MSETVYDCQLELDAGTHNELLTDEDEIIVRNLLSNAIQKIDLLDLEMARLSEISRVQCFTIE